MTAPLFVMVVLLLAGVAGIAWSRWLREPKPYSDRWHEREERRLVADTIADVERHLRLRAEFEDYCRQRGQEPTL